MMISMIEGGIRMPSVPEAATTPAARRLSYPASSMIGREMVASSTTEAPTMPVEAASRMPISTTAMASPPLTRPRVSANDRISFSASPDWSSISPMKTNIGKATSTAFSIVPNIRCTMIR